MKRALLLALALLLLALPAAGCGRAEPAAAEGEGAEESFHPDLMMVYGLGTSYIRQIYDPDEIGEIYGLYQSFQIGGEVEVPAFDDHLRVSFKDNSTGEILAFYVVSGGENGYYGVYDGEAGAIRFYELEDGKAIHQFLAEYTQAMSRENSFTADRVQITIGTESATVSGSQTWWIYGSFTALEVLRVTQPPQGGQVIELTFTDEDHADPIRRVTVYGSGVISPEPEEGRSRYYYETEDGINLYDLSLAYFNARSAEMVPAGEYCPLLLLNQDGTVELYDLNTEAPGLRKEAMSRELAARRLSEMGRFPTIYLLDASGESTGEFYAMLADSIVTDPGEIQRLFGWTIE